MNDIKILPVAIIGAGPAGLAAAAHLAVNNQPFLLFEAGAAVANNILSWAHVRIFSPWRYNIDKAARQLLEASGGPGHRWRAPDDEVLPTGGELYQHYFQPLAALPAIQPSVFLESRVLSVGRKNLDKVKTKGRDQLPFVVQVLHRQQQVKQYEVKAVIDASGTWNTPNPIGSGGVYAVGEVEHSHHIFYGIPNVLGKHQDRYKNKSVVVVGSGHSAVNTILDLDRLKEAYPGTQIHWVLRKKHVSEVYGGREDDALPARGALGVKIEQMVNDDRINVYTPFQIQQIIKEEGKLTLTGLQYEELKALPGIDEIISNTGSRPDFTFLREVRLHTDPSLESVAAIAELIDPNIHSCGTVRPHGERELRHPDKDFYIVGSKSYGRAPTFLMATGYEQVRSIVAAIMGDWEAARQVALELPETGVCSTSNPDTDPASGAACCGAPAASEKVASACCG